MNFGKFFKGIARVQSTFSLEAGPIRAQGVPAILVAVSGIVLAAGAANFLVRSGDRIPDMLSEARNLALALQKERPRLQA